MRTREEILSRAIEVLGERPDVDRVEQGGSCTVQVSGPTGERVLWLGPLLSEAERVADEPCWLERRLDAMLGDDRAPDTFEEARGYLSVRLVSSSWFGGEARFSDCVWRPAGPGLAEIVCLDRPLARATMSRWNVGVEEVLGAGRLANRLAEVEVERPLPGTSLMMVRSRDGVASAFAVDLEQLRSWAECDEVVCAFPRADLLLLSRADDREALLRLIEIAADEYARGERVISPLAYRAGESGLTAFDPVEAGRKERLQVAVFHSRLYERQRAVLELAGDAEAELLTEPEVDESLDDRPGLLVRWKEGEDHLLPDADLVDLTDHAGHRRLLPFSTVVEAGGDALELTAHFPRRWRTRRFPHEIMPDHH